MLCGFPFLGGLCCLMGGVCRVNSYEAEAGPIPDSKDVSALPRPWSLTRSTW
jgi:hypothetical protein